MIRVITRGDIEPFHFLVHKNRERLNTYFPMTVFHTNSMNNTRAFVEEKIREARQQEFLLMMIHNEQGKLVGMAQTREQGDTGAGAVYIQPYGHGKDILQDRP